MGDRAIVVAGWALMPPANDIDEPRVRDTDLAERLGYDRPRKIREIIMRMIESGELSGLHVRPAVGRTSSSSFGALTPAVCSTQLVRTLSSPQHAASACMPRTSRRNAA